MTKSQLRARSGSSRPKSTTATGARAPDTPADILARGWIAALERLGPSVEGPPPGAPNAICPTEDWVIETLLKLGFAAPDRAYEVGLRIVELTDDPWVLETVKVSVFEDLLRRDSVYRQRLSADAKRLPNARRVIDGIANGRVLPL